MATLADLDMVAGLASLDIAVVLPDLDIGVGLAFDLAVTSMLVLDFATAVVATSYSFWPS